METQEEQMIQSESLYTISTLQAKADTLNSTEFGLVVWFGRRVSIAPPRWGYQAFWLTANDERGYEITVWLGDSFPEASRMLPEMVDELLGWCALPF